jgi:hypothetical protein
MDRCFQGEGGRGRIAGMLAGPILEKSIQSVRWLARMEATNRVRSTWLLCLIYIHTVESRKFVRIVCVFCCHGVITNYLLRFHLQNRMSLK